VFSFETGSFSCPVVVGASRYTTTCLMQESVLLVLPSWGWCCGDVRPMVIAGFGWSPHLSLEPEVVLALEPPAVCRRAGVPVPGRSSVRLGLPELEWAVRSGGAGGSRKVRFAVQGRQSTGSHVQCLGAPSTVADAADCFQWNRGSAGKGLGCRVTPRSLPIGD